MAERWPGRRLFFLLNSPAAVAAQVRGRVGALGLASSRRISRSIAPTFVCIETFHLERVGTDYF